MHAQGWQWLDEVRHIGMIAMHSFAAKHALPRQRNRCHHAVYT